MNKVKILIEGYAKELSGGWKATCTTTLIITPKKKIVIDPGINRKLLLNSLLKSNLTSGDIDYVFLTHYHPDHAFLAAIFESSTLFDGDVIYKNDIETPFKGKLPDTDIEVVPTPGHAYEHASLLVKSEEKETIAVAGDVFWWVDSEKQETDYESLINHEDPFTKDKSTLKKSRKLLIKKADWIIPGHGKMFKSPKK
jgi:glyoxylase-like metal-dependent hydrolase (beta-lactamase superfamily II)